MSQRTKDDLDAPAPTRRCECGRIIHPPPEERYVDSRPRRSLVSPTRCSCGGTVEEGEDICNMCRFDHATRTYA